MRNLTLLIHPAGHFDCSNLDYFLSPLSTYFMISVSGITAVLTLSTIALDSRTGLPKVHYATALDWFIICSFLYCMGSLLEFAGVHYFTKVDKTGEYFLLIHYLIRHVIAQMTYLIRGILCIYIYFIVFLLQFLSLFHISIF